MSESTAVAEIEKLTVEVGGRRIVDGVSLRVLPGRVTALVGASGSGKTTTGRALLGEFPSGARVTGSVRVDEALVGYVPQHPAAVLNPARRVGALLYDIARGRVRELPRRARRAGAREHVLNALAMAQLPDGSRLLRRFPHQLSGGQQQRVVLVQALLLGARVVVADEPTTGQDALTKRRVVDELAAVAARGIGVVLLSHDLETVRALADEVLVMRDGRVVESGPTERVWLAPSHPWTRQLLAEQPPLRGGAPATSDSYTVLRVRDLRARHRDVEVLHTPELVLRSGECLAVLGRSGSGKTTLARCVAGLHRRYEGEVLLDGVALPPSLRDRTRAQLATVQYVFQDARASFDERRPVLDQVARTAVRLRGVPPREARAEAAEVFNSLGLADELAARSPARLSGGELQRAALARALLARPRVLVCDEITSGLDTVTRRGILDLLAGLLRDGDDLSLVLITHDLDTARLASRIAVLDAGEVVEQGSAEDILTAPTHPFTMSLTEKRLVEKRRAQIQPSSHA
ncbi:ATP-binding cassette domain-containing protein [Streptomyces phaeochromogenes]|uniref:ATP-binding cassette domain-containing protein n=1 Tax=Streptomyces phaeochromogenes TaxID=1923 RepID=A0ABZ1H2P0_STRPH|nr:ATP-binding cassette domain-containing protein [Streptomyces phaeochromogenes]WSD12822.1 ATP-binding cassette domain-containing protein [Streptomyces phaeochromogenes]